MMRAVTQASWDRGATVELGNHTRMLGSTRHERAWQQVTRGRRALPDFVIFGAAKSGTSAAYDFLGSHPLVVANRTKEIHFADRPWNASRGERWYRSWFPPVARLRQVGRRHGVERAWCGEATPDYLATPGSAARLAAAAPRARLVALLREPGARAWSNYRMSHRGSADPEEFWSAIQAEAETRVDGRYVPSDDFEAVHHGYLRQGHYADQLEEWFAAFEADSILLVRSEDLFADPDVTLARLCAHIGMPESAIGTQARLRRVNAGDGSSDLPAAVRDWLDQYFADPNRRLAELSGGAVTWPTSVAGPS